MELFQLRVGPGAGRAFTPSRGSAVVITHVALCVGEGETPGNASERVVVTITPRGGGGGFGDGDDARGDAISIGTLRNGDGREQFSLGGSGLRFGDETRVEVRHTGKTASVVATGRVEATTERDDEEDSFEEDSSEEESDEEDASMLGDSMSESESESDGEEDMICLLYTSDAADE